jgi:CubicO group peptidase (beta-lactamase class C family)
VVDLWGGHKEPGRSKLWAEDTIVSMASVVKGMLAFALHMLADRGRIDYDKPVASYWPEFAENGKERITVRQAISHHAAIHFIDAARPGDFFRWDRMVAAIARQKPEWPPGTRGVYHTISIIFILGKLIQCASGEYPWDFFRREITEKLGVDYHVRMRDAELARFSQDFETGHFINDAQLPPDVMARFFAGMGDPTSVLTPEELKALPYQIAGGNSRGAARLFAFAAMDGEIDGVRVLSPRTIDLMTEVQWYEKCAVWGTPMRTALGLLVNDPEFFYIGPNPLAFGTAGAGGSFAMADRQNRLSVGYCVNSWWPALALGDRARTLIDSVYAAY